MLSRLGQVERRDRRRPASCVDAVLDGLEIGRGPRGKDDMGAVAGQRLGGRGADPAARAGHQRELAVEKPGHQA